MGVSTSGSARTSSIRSRDAESRRAERKASFGLEGFTGPDDYPALVAALKGAAMTASG